MIDEIIKGIGNSRYLKTSLSSGMTWEEALAMLRAGKFPVDFSGKNMGGIVQKGTNLNKANLLSDATAAKFFPEKSDYSNITVDDVLNALGVQFTNLRTVTELIVVDQTWTCPSVAGNVSVMCIGGGGGGGDNGAGGGGGGYLTEGSFAISQGTQIKCTIGIGGRSSESGGTTSFGSLLSAAGGGAGERVADGTSGLSGYAASGAGGVGGTDGGHSGWPSGATSGGNRTVKGITYYGGRAGEGGKNANVPGGGGGAGYRGHGGDGATATGTTNPYTSGGGEPGSGFGAGGGGGSIHGHGGGGTDGVIELTYQVRG